METLSTELLTNIFSDACQCLVSNPREEGLIKMLYNYACVCRKILARLVLLIGNDSQASGKQLYEDNCSLNFANALTNMVAKI